MRDAQCQLASGNAALAGMVCEVILTQKRADELEMIDETGSFSSFSPHNKD